MTARLAEIHELEDQLEDEVLCNASDAAHRSTGTGCGIVATHRVASTCPYEGAALLVCRPLAEWVKADTGPCPTCGVPLAQCWVVSAL